jgi:Spy/CpxP family protein refolding chaperone
MRSKSELLILVACAAAVAVVASDAETQPRMGWGDGWDRASRLEILADRLDLTDEQVDAIEKLREERAADCAELRKEMMRVRNEIRGEMLEDDPDLAKIKDLIARKAEISSRLQISRIEGRLEFREILTPEQRDLLPMLGRAGRGGGFFKEDRGYRRGRMNRGRGWGDGPGVRGRFRTGSRQCLMW